MKVIFIHSTLSAICLFFFSGEVGGTYYVDVDFHVEHTSSDEYLIIILYIIPADNFLYRKIIWHYFLGGESVLYQTMV